MNHSYYDTVTYENILKSFVGEAKMFEAQRSLGGPKVALCQPSLVVIASLRLSFGATDFPTGLSQITKVGSYLPLATPLLTLRTQSTQV